MPTARPGDPTRAIHFEVHGKGVPLFVGFPLMASHAEVFGEAAGAVLAGYLERLTDRYSVLLADYPSIGRSGTIPPGDFTADRVAEDLLAVADAAGFERFAFWGHSWGGAAALQLASRTDRLSALVVGGWPPLGGAYDEILRAARLQVASPPAYVMAVLRSPGQYAQWVTFYESLRSWHEEESAGRLTCPRLVYAGANGDSDAGGIAIPIASTIRARRADLERMGWTVREIPDRDHAVFMEPSVLVPVVRDFLDAAA